MMDNFDIKIESILDKIMGKADLQNIELVCDKMYDESDHRSDNAVFVQNVESERIGMICMNLEGKDPDEIQFLTFWPKLYQYSVQEGFSKQQSFEAFGDKILINVSLKEFTSFILSDETY